MGQFFSNMFEKNEEKMSRKELRKQKEEKKAMYKKRLALLTSEERGYLRRKNFVDHVWPVVRFLILFGMTFVVLYPLIFMLSAAFMPKAQMDDPTVLWIPKSVTMQNVKDVMRITDFWGTLKNTLVLNVVCSILQVITCAITGYGFARFNFKLKKLLFGIVIMMIMVPPQIILIPQFMFFRYFNPLGIWHMITGEYIKLTDTFLAMYLPALTANGLRAGLFILIFRQFFKGLPKELEDAAYLDGYSPFATFVKVMCPNAASSFLTVFLFSVVWYWNDYYISTSFFTNNKTIALALKNLDQTLRIELFGNGTVAISAKQIIVWMEAGCLLSVAPMLLIYIFLQKYFTEGIERSGLVG